MSPWSVIGWCLAVLAILGTLVTLGFVIGSVGAWAWVMLTSTEKEKVLKKMKETKPCVGCAKTAKTESLEFCGSCRSDLADFRRAQMAKNKSKWDVG